MKLGVGDRFGIMGLIQGQEGDFVTLKILRDLQGELAPSEDEVKKLKIVQSNGRITWQEKAGEEKDVNIGEKANDIIVLALAKLNEQKKLRQEHYNLYEMFIVKGNGDKET